MSFKVPQHSPYQRNSSNHSFSNEQGRNTSYNSPHMTACASVPAWGSPAVGYSPRGNQQHKSPYNQSSPRGNHYQSNGQFSQSPRGHNNCQNRNYHQSPRHNTPNVSQNRFSSPNDGFKTPQSPLNRSYSSPASYNSFNSSGKRPFNQRFQQNSRHGRFQQRGTGSIEDYYSNCMIDDPWKFTPPVPVLTKS